MQIRTYKESSHRSRLMVIIAQALYHDSRPVVLAPAWSRDYIGVFVRWQRRQPDLDRVGEISGEGSSNHIILRAFIDRAREQTDTGDECEPGRCAFSQAVSVDIRKPARSSSSARQRVASRQKYGSMTTADH